MTDTARQVRWLDWCARLQAVAQTGLTFARDPYDLERYQALGEIAAEMLAAGSGLEVSAIRDLVSRDSGYATPKVDVRGAVFRNDKLLLVQERSDEGWSLPGGWADVGESPAENVTREIYEETGFHTRPVKILAVFDRSQHPHAPRFPFHVYKIFVRCEITGGTATSSPETPAVAFFGETEIPELSISRVTPWQIKRMFHHHRDPEASTDFDPVIQA